MAKRHWNRKGDLESLFLHLEELVLANSGEDEFEEIFKLLVAKLWDERAGKAPKFYGRASEVKTFEVVCTLLREAEKAWPGILGMETRPRLTPEHLQVCVEALARHSIGGKDLQVLDGFFEHLVSKGAKGSKGQYFTPRHVVDLCVRVLRPTKSETVCDPGCGSGGFLLHALSYVRDHERLSEVEVQQYCCSKVWGFDLDGRAVRVAKALMLLAGDGKANIIRLNSLLRPDIGGLFPLVPKANSGGETESLLTIEDVCRSRRRQHVGFDVILTNPPFAGEVRERHILDGYVVSRGKARVERDVLFIERCIELLRPGGRLGIVLPHNKFAGSAFRSVREWLLKEARILGVISLGRNTFLPHTHQKASVLFVQRRMKGERRRQDERVFFAISERAGKDSKGRFLLRGGSPTDGRVWDSVDHDFERIVEAFHKSMEEAELGWSRGTALCNVKKVGGLGQELVLAPERYDPRRASLTEATEGTRLGEVAEVMRVTVSPKETGEATRFLVLNTSDAREGVVVCRKGTVALADVGSTKKSVERGCVLISRLRPYLRQVALADAEIPGWNKDVRMICSTEFFVLRSVDGRSISFLVPFLLSDPVQMVLAASQEGGHHPRFDQSTLLDLPVPKALLERREDNSSKLEAAVAMFRQYERRTGRLLENATRAFTLTSS